MAELPAIYHRAYSLAVAQWKTLELGGHPTELQLAAVQHFVSVHIFAEYPGTPRTVAANAIRYGMASAERDLTSTDQGGVVGTVGAFVTDVVDTVESAAQFAEHEAAAAVRSVEGSIRATLAQILRAVRLPRAALPAKVPTSLTAAYATTAREVGTTTPTRLAAAGRTRIAIRRLGR